MQGVTIMAALAYLLTEEDEEDYEELIKHLKKGK